MTTQRNTHPWGVGPFDPDSPTLKELFCERYRIKESDFNWVCYRRSLYPRAYFVWPLLLCFRKEEVKADLELIEDLGSCRSFDEVYQCIHAFHLHWVNASFVRDQLRLRLSFRRMMRMARALFRPAQVSWSAGRESSERVATTDANTAVAALEANADGGRLGPEFAERMLKAS